MRACPDLCVGRGEFRTSRSTPQQARGHLPGFPLHLGLPLDDPVSHQNLPVADGGIDTPAVGRVDQVIDQAMMRDHLDMVKINQDEISEVVFPELTGGEASTSRLGPT